MTKSTNERKVQSEDLQKADDEIRSSARSKDPVDALTTFTKIVGVNAHNEKRRSTEEASPSKRHETREPKMREIE